VISVISGMTITGKIIGAAIEVHKLLGPGFLEGIYQQALLHELSLQGFSTEREVGVDIGYKNLTVGHHRIDIIVNKWIILELKAVNAIARIHFAQMLSYLKATGLEVGLILNFGEPKLTFKRVILSRESRELRELI
jgi:GxxExxY protein